MNVLKNLSKVSLIGLTLAGVMAVFTTATNAAEVTQIITANDLQTNKLEAWQNGGWFFYDDLNDTIHNDQGTFVTGPETAPFGLGSVQISTTGLQRPNIATYQFKGIPLADITYLRFSTYKPSAGNGGSANRSGYLHFNVDFNSTDTWQRRLVFVPRNNSSVVQDEWQEWDAINGGNALWSYSGSTWPGTATPGTALKSWSQIINEYPGVKTRTTDSFMGVRVGEPYADGYTENIDGFVFGANGDVTTFDFEPLVGPSDKASCKNGGWMSFNNPTFKNQGDCVSFVAAKK